MRKQVSVLCLAAAVAVLPVMAAAEPISFEQAANVTGLAGIEVGADFDYSYEKIEQSGIGATLENTLTDIPVFVRVGIPILEAKLSVPYGMVKQASQFTGPVTLPAAEEAFNGLKNIDLMVKTGLLNVAIMSVGFGVEASLPTGDPEKLLGEGFDFLPFLAAGLDLMIFKLNANVGYEYRGEFKTTVDQGGGVTTEVTTKPGDAFHYGVGLQIPAGDTFSLHAELIGSSFGSVKQTQDGIDVAFPNDGKGATFSFVPGVRAHAGPFKAKLGVAIPLEREEDRPTLAPRADWRILAGASLQFSL